MNQLLQQSKSIAKLPVKQQVEQWDALLDLNPTTNQYIAMIYNENIGDLDHLSDVVERYEIFNNEWYAFNEVLVSFIRLSNQFNPWSVMESFDLYGKFLEDLSVAFNNNQRGWILLRLLKSAINFILPLANKLDIQLYYKENRSKPRLSWMASILLKIFNNIRSQVTEENFIKTTIIIFIGTKLCQIYFKISNPLLCRNVFSNINNLNLDVKKYDKNEIIMYRYYLSKFYLIKNQLIDSYQNLNWCLIHSPIIKDHGNIIKFIQLLIPISILIGKKPNFNFINDTYFSQRPKFMYFYENLYKAIHHGNLPQFNKLIQFNFNYLKKLNLLIIIESKALILIVRNLFYKTWKLNHQNPVLHFHTLQIALNYIKFPYKVDDTLVENLLISLIDQNLIKGKILPRTKSVPLAKTAPFVTIDEINFKRFGNGNEFTLDGNDRWLESLHN